MLILHGTGGSGAGFLSRTFGGELFGPGQLLDASRYFIVLPDGIGHGKSSKPRDGLRSRVRCLGGSPGRIGSRGRSALWELLLEAERERDQRPVRPNFRTPARTATQTSARSIFGGCGPGHNPQSPEGGKGSGRSRRSTCEGFVVRGTCDAG